MLENFPRMKQPPACGSDVFPVFLSEVSGISLLWHILSISASAGSEKPINFTRSDCVFLSFELFVTPQWRLVTEKGSKWKVVKKVIAFIFLNIKVLTVNEKSFIFL